MSDDDREEMSFEMKAAGELIDLALDIVEEFEEDEKDDIILDILTEAVSGILVAQKIMHPNFRDELLLSQAFDKIRMKYKSKNCHVVLLSPDDIN